MAKYGVIQIQSHRSYTDKTTNQFKKYGEEKVWAVLVPEYQITYWKMNGLVYPNLMLPPGVVKKPFQIIEAFEYKRNISVWDPGTPASGSTTAVPGSWSQTTKDVKVRQHQKSVPKAAKKGRKNYYKILTGQKTPGGNPASQYWAFHRSFRIYEVKQVLACLFDAAEPDIRPTRFWTPAGAQHDLIYPATFEKITDFDHTSYVLKPGTTGAITSPAGGGDPTTPTSTQLSIL